MKTFNEVTNDKLRGGFYSPASLVTLCLDRILALTESKRKLRVLEPSVGDGAFLRQMSSHPLESLIETFVGLEIIGSEVQKCRIAARDLKFETAIHLESTLRWAIESEEEFDVAIGNPPFVRFQYVSKGDLDCIEKLGKKLNFSFRGVGNLWIPILIAAGSKLCVGGSMAFIVPAEIFTGLAAGDVRNWLLKNFSNIQLDMFSPGSFPDVLQEIVIISGRRINYTQRVATQYAQVAFVEHGKSGDVRSWQHSVPFGSQSWTRFLLTPKQVDTYDQLRQLPQVLMLSKIAKIEVSIVTGANDFFSVSAEEVSRFQLQNWIEPLLPRIRYAEGLVYEKGDHQATVSTGVKAWLLNFSKQHPDPQTVEGAARYLEIGEMLGLDARYKTSIRTPWYRVPSVWAGQLLLSKRSHLFPRLVYNAAGAVTTDTIYRGQMHNQYAGRELDLVGAFHNSLTLLSAEVEGRSFGGGVLELVPSEVARLSIPFPVHLSDSVPKLTKVMKEVGKNSESAQNLVDITDSLLIKQIKGLSLQLVQEIADARLSLMQRRLSRN